MNILYLIIYHEIINDVNEYICKYIFNYEIFFNVIE